jgi:energy-coupling factor transport system permease protein
MLTDITIGQYFPGASLLHRLDPRTKIILLFLFIIGIFVFDTPLSYGLLSLFTVSLIYFSQVPMRMMIKSIKPLWWILLFTFLINLCSVSGEAFAHIWIFALTWEGLRQAVFICLRLILLILLSSLLTFTTSPLALTDALENLMGPFKRLGMPAHELAMMMTIALRFVPTLIEETDKIMKAQKSRGSDFSSGSLLHRVKSLIPILVPLFISAFRRADELAMAMEARCYRGGVGRTQMKALRITTIDYVAYGASLLFACTLVGLKVIGI